MLRITRYVMGLLIILVWHPSISALAVTFCSCFGKMKMEVTEEQVCPETGEIISPSPGTPESQPDAHGCQIQAEELSAVLIGSLPLPDPLPDSFAQNPESSQSNGNLNYYRELFFSGNSPLQVHKKYWFHYSLKLSLIRPLTMSI